MGGLGLTLTGADRVVVLDPSWNPAEDAQAVDRAHRLGQTKKVVVMRLIGAGTVEEKVYEKQVYKDGLRRTLTTATRKADEGEEGCQGGGGGDGEDDEEGEGGVDDEGGGVVSAEGEASDEGEGDGWHSKVQRSASKEGAQRQRSNAASTRNVKHTEAHRYFTRDELRRLFVLGPSGHSEAMVSIYKILVKTVINYNYGYGQRSLINFAHIT